MLLPGKPKPRESGNTQSLSAHFLPLQGGDLPHMLPSMFEKRGLPAASLSKSLLMEDGYITQVPHALPSTSSRRMMSATTRTPLKKGNSPRLTAPPRHEIDGPPHGAPQQPHPDAHGTSQQHAIPMKRRSSTPIQDRRSPLGSPQSNASPAGSPSSVIASPFNLDMNVDQQTPDQDGMSPSSQVHVDDGAHFPATTHPHGRQDDPTEPSPSPIGHFREPLRDLGQDGADPDNLHRLDAVMDDFTSTIQHHLSIKMPSSGARTERNPPNAEDAATMHRLYRGNRRRTLRLITKEEAPRCCVTAEDVFLHFSTTWTAKAYDPQYFDADSSLDDDPLGTSFSAAEVALARRKAENSAPGPDRITYKHLKEVDPEGITLATLFNACRRLRRTTTAWKTSATILLPKDGDPADITNWRPITLCSTMYKLFAKCSAARLYAWCERNDIISHAQKGFLPHDGVMEHSFLLQHRLEWTRKNRAESCLAWLDLSNAFGSVPHGAILHALRSAWAGRLMTDLVADLYSETMTNVLTDEGPTPDIPIAAGVKQGCPLSGILFNLVIDAAI
ncbi:uncharacterized protein LOC129230409 [Uloborus diversus]|uniref:uncharacterized protein LOC129230409 n=1 Tax=Uloborus diversus TaxID=327109 RepID=UPI00240A5A1E|nr:uncharacterized protein LOC129230409 [Uloborus diversus]